MIWHQQHKKAELRHFFKSLMKSSELSVLHAQVHMLTLLSAPISPGLATCRVACHEAQEQDVA